MMAQMFEPYLQYKPVDNFDLSLNISEPAEPSPPPSRSSPVGRQTNNHGQLHHREHTSYSDNNNMADQTFHTPSFGDEDFDLAPPSLGALQSPPQPVVQIQQQQHQMQHQAQQQQHRQSPPQHHPNAPQEGSAPSNMVSQTNSVPGEAQLPPNSSSNPHMDINYGNRPMAAAPIQMHHPQQQMEQQQVASYGPRGGDVMYMQPPPPPMPQQQRMTQHMQMSQIHNHQHVMYDPTRYPNMTAMNNHIQMQQQQQQQQQQQMVYANQMRIMRPPQMMHVQQGHQMGPQGHLHHPIGPGSAGSGSPPNSNHTSSPGLETGSEDSDDCGPFAQQMMGGMKRPSPEPMDPSPHTNMQQQAGNGAQNNTTAGKGVAKKPKVQKKKKKKDPNEPQKPVSAYALFFRDTQAAIKGQNPNASFGEVSKIVASMWDTLDVDHKDIYKRKTEAAKKEYLKALAAYRASLVSKAASEQSDSIYGNHQVSNVSMNNSPPRGHQQAQQQQQQQQHHQINSGSGGLSPLQKKSPLLTSLMEAGGGSPGSNMPPNTYMNNGSNSPSSPPVQQQGQMAGGQVWNMHPSMNSANMGGVQSQNQQQQQQQQGHMINLMHSGGNSMNQGGNRGGEQQQVKGKGASAQVPQTQQSQQQQQQQTTGANHDQQHQGNGNNSNQQQSSTMANNTTNSSSYTPNYLGGQRTNSSGGDGNSSVGGGGGGANRENYPPRPPPGPVAPVNTQTTENSVQQRCLRNGCTNPAVNSPDWDQEYCSNDCVVSHCRDVFTNWVTARQDSSANNANFASVK